MSPQKSFTDQFCLEPDDFRRIAALVGADDENIRQIEKRLNVEINYQG